jgi:predicted metal-dependent hydrolase
MTKPIIVLVSHQNTWDTLQAQLPDYTIKPIAQAGAYMNTLIESRSAMVIIDGEHPEWQRFTTAPTTSPATRRIPIVVVSDNPTHREQAQKIGADFTFARADIHQHIQTLVQNHARIPDPDKQHQLMCDCDQPLPSLAQRGVDAFNNGDYYAQHDLFEEQWVNTTSPVRDLYRAILQVGIAYYQIERGNHRGALKMLQRSVQWLTILPDICQTIDIAQLRQDSYAVRAELERLGADRLHEFDSTLLKPIIQHKDTPHT